MNRIRKFQLASVLLVIVHTGWSQSAIPNISDYTKTVEVLPPSSNAASLGKYGGIDLSPASGMTGINIPLYEYNSINLKLPLSLSYSSNGFRVDELASRVGTGWSLNAGGVITRTVYGATDEQAQRLSPPAGFPARSAALVQFMDNLAGANAYGPFDAQPDIFSFNISGASGRFILDSNLNPALLSHSAMKIECDFTSAVWNFKITNTDGIQYFFGGDAATEKTKKLSSGNGCGKTYATFIPTAWYLKKIVHPSNDTITFSYTHHFSQYTTGISETMYAPNFPAGQFPYCAGYSINTPVLNNSACATVLQTSGVVLQEINASGGGRISFSYTDRNDGDDKLLAAIKVYPPGSDSVIRVIAFTYDYAVAGSFKNTYSNTDTRLNNRPFLEKIAEKSPDNLLAKEYSFSYTDKQSLPPRLSYAQDAYGFFNGKNNTTLIPQPSSLAWRQKLPAATADRSVNPEYAQKGLLNAVIYPTGGKDSIVYESNQVYGPVPNIPSPVTVTASATSMTAGGSGTTVYSTSATISFGQEVRFTGACSSTGTGGGDPAHDRAVITLLDESNTVLFTQTLQPGNTFDQVLNLPAGHNYTIKTTAYWEDVTGTATLWYVPGNITYQNLNSNAGGVRVQKLITSDGITGNSQVKRYFYHALTNPGVSSGGPVYTPRFDKALTVTVPCMDGASTDPNNPAGIVNCDLVDFSFLSMYSNTQNNIYTYPSPVSYGSVIESLGENYENGGTEYQYTVYGDMAASQIVGNGDMANGPLSSYAWKNAREVYRNVFKKEGDQYVPVKKIFTSYKEDVRADREIKAYTANKKYTVHCTSSAPDDREVNAYDLFSYVHFRKWIYPDTIRTWDYDARGQHYLEQLQITEYGNPAHALPTKQITYAGDGSLNSVVKVYPQDLILTGTAEIARQTLVAKNMLGTVLSQQFAKGTGILFQTRTDYKIFSGGLLLPEVKYIQKTGYPMEEAVRFYRYNNRGNLVEQSKAGDVKEVYVWGCQSLYPVAKVTGSDAVTVYNLINQTVLDNPLSTAQQVRTELDKIRTGLAGTPAQVITFTYIPAVGISSQTDPNGKTMYYAYDKLGRLIQVTDSDGNVIKKMEYQYRQ